PELRGSELARLGGAELPSALPECDISRVRSAQDAVCEAVRSGALVSAGDIGAEVGLADTVKPLRGLFGEAPGGFVVSGADADLRALAERVPMHVVGT